MRPTLVIVAAVLVADASAFSVGVPTLTVASTAPARNALVPQPQMGLSLSTISSSITTVLYAVLGGVAGTNLVDKVPKLVGGGLGAGLQVGDVVVDAILLVVAAVQLGKIVGILGKIPYSELEGLPKSYALEAGARALAGEVASRSEDGRYEVASFAGGCFWGTELHFQRIPGVVATCVGYTQGRTDAPTYEQVCSGTTGHTEALQLIYDPSVCSYERLCATLFQTIAPDATALNRKGNDRGTQCNHARARTPDELLRAPSLVRIVCSHVHTVRVHAWADRHGIYTHTASQAEAARAVFESEQRMYGDVPIVTELKPATVFWPAEGYHRTRAPHAPRINYACPCINYASTQKTRKARPSRCAPTAQPQANGGSSAREPILTVSTPTLAPNRTIAERYLEKGGQSAAKDERDPVRCYG